MKKVEEEIKILRAEIEKIKARNRRVEADKAWETSRIRSFFIAGAIYLVTVIYMVLINSNNPLLNALVPLIGYLLSTATYGILKNWWLNKKRNN